ncbi:LacI family DNA-binding transcriptional regulator [Propionibacteriaceae bacterium G1746]|uniref:LacI family DNA-binding transcriptional regulator n=1 Tax=Aestuariimicrobium sp. G57 TaxID=3418485 RepID=UPI003C175787
MTSKPTIYSLAEELGVHPATVSRAFSRPELVSAELRTKVLALAEQRGFRVNVAARQLVTGRSGLLGLLVPDIENMYFTTLFHSMSRLGAAMGLSVVVTDWRFMETQQAEIFDRVLGVVDALVVAAPRDDVMTYMARRRKEVPLVFINRLIPGASCVVVDNREALWQLGDEMLAQGHHAIAAVAGPTDSWAAAQRINDVESWARARNVELTVLGHCEPSIHGGIAMAGAVEQSGATAVFCFDDLMASGLIKGLQTRGIRTPEDISVVGCDDASVALVTSPSLTTVRAPYDELAEQVMGAVTGLLKSPEATRQVSIDGVPILRESLGPAPHAGPRTSTKKAGTTR